MARTKLGRQKMPISVRYALRSPKKGEAYSNPHTLEVWVTVDGKRAHLSAVWPLDKSAQSIRVNPEEWNVSKQVTSRRNDPANRSLTALKAHIEAIYEEQETSGATATIASVMRHLSVGFMPAWDGNGWDLDGKRTASGMSSNSQISQTYTSYIAHLESLRNTPAALSKITLGRWKRGLFLLDAFQQETGQAPKLNSPSLIGWAKRFHQWLQTEKPNKKYLQPSSAAQASRFLWKLSTVLRWACEEGWAQANPLEHIRWPRGADKEVKFLEPHHVYRLMQTKWEGMEGVALWWFLLMCCTGLDYPDAIQYARNRNAYEKEGVGGRKIVGKRLKSPHNEYHIPLLNEVDSLFAIYPTGPADYSSQCVNRHTARMEELLGIDWRITAKTARKTFGCMILAAGATMEEVSRMLGHDSVRTTEKYYVKVSGRSVDRAMLRISTPSIEQLSHPFLNVT